MEETASASNGRWQTLASAWELMAVSFRNPEELLANAVASGEWDAALHEISEVLGLRLANGSGSEMVGHDVDDALRELRAEYARLFVGAPEPAVSPYGSVWLSRQKGVDALLFVNPYARAVERFFNACGLGRSQSSNEPLDHVAIECELLQYLASIEAGLVMPPEDAIPALGFPGGAANSAHAQFLSEHVSPWLPDFLQALEKEARISFYGSLASFALSLVNALS